MEKYSQYRDRGSGIAPFLPHTTPTSTIALPWHLFLFVFKLPFFAALTVSYFLLLQFLPLGILFRKAILWAILGLPGIWWIDLQVDGVKRGALGSERGKERLPRGGDVIASSFTSPIDALYLAAIFDPIFTVSYPHTRQVRQISLVKAMLRALSAPETQPPAGAKLVSIQTLLKRNPKRIVVVFPECSTTNGRGILPLSPALLSVTPSTKIFPLNMRYTPADITTPIPGQYFGFIWNLLSQQTHCIRVRIAEATYNDAKRTEKVVEQKDRYLENLMETLNEKEGLTNGVENEEELNDGEVNAAEQAVLDRVGEALARLGRVKRVGLTVEDKAKFVKAWTKK